MASPNNTNLFFATLVALTLNLSSGSFAQPANYFVSKKNMVVSVHPLATDAGLAAFEKGGNAVDAAIATALTLGVVDGFNSGIGGGCFILIRTPSGDFFAIDGREMAPGASHPRMYLRNGKPDPVASKVGPLAIGVPGALDAYSAALSRHGRLTLKDLIEPAASIAELGFRISPNYSDKIANERNQILKFASTTEVLLKKDQSIYSAGDRLIQKDLAKTYRNISKFGPDWFYRGEFSQTASNWLLANGGIITEEDFASYRTKDRKPIRTTYRDFEVIGFPPPSSGGIHVGQILNILKNFDLLEMHRDDPEKMQHVVVEAMKLAFADRAYWLGDADYADVPIGLISESYGQRLAQQIDLQKSTRQNSHGTPPNASTELFGSHTTHMATADREGYWVALTTTLNTRFGSKVMIPGTGVIMNNQMDDFSIAPGFPNAYGLIGSHRNEIQAGKRPLSSMSPTIILRDGVPVFSIGAAGGPKIISQAVWAIVRHLDLGWPVAKSISDPRLHHQWAPDVLFAENSIDESKLQKLRVRGHKIRKIPSHLAGVSQAIGYDPKSKRFVGAFDPRISGKSAGQ